MCVCVHGREFDIPGHSKGFEPLAWGTKPAIKFCGELPGVNQLYDDPEGKSKYTTNPHLNPHLNHHLNHHHSLIEQRHL